jgi:hypothetical protein
MAVDGRTTQPFPFDGKCEIGLRGSYPGSDLLGILAVVATLSRPPLNSLN